MIKFLKISFFIILVTFFHGCEEKKDLKFKFKVSQNQNESKTDQEIQESQAEKDLRHRVMVFVEPPRHKEHQGKNFDRMNRINQMCS